MKLDDLKCEFCDGHGEREINIDGMDAPCICTFCNETGIDQDQLKLLMTEQLTMANKYLDKIKELAKAVKSDPVQAIAGIRAISALVVEYKDDLPTPF